MMKLQKSYVCLEHLRFHAYHGVFQQERMVGNDYDVSLRLGYPLATAMQSDRVEDTLNYATVFQLVKEEMEKPVWDLSVVTIVVALLFIVYFFVPTVV